MKQIRVAIIACLFLCVTASSAQSNGCYSGYYYSPGYWALPLILFGIPVLSYALSGGYSRASVYTYPSNVYYESPPRTYLRTTYRTQPAEVKQSPIPISTSLQRTVGDPKYSYYCRSPRGYYPDVMECPLGWKKVLSIYYPIDHQESK